MADEQKSADPAVPPEAAQAAELPKPRPEGEPPAVAAVRDLIEAKLVELVGGYAVDPHGSYVVGMDSARVFVVPAWLDDDTVVARLFAITNLDVPVTAELTSFLLAKNLEFVVGAFALDVENGAVWFNHNLIAGHMSPDELGMALAAVAQTANQFDDDIKERFGGRLYIETPDQAVPTPPAPGYL